MSLIAVLVRTMLLLAAALAPSLAAAQDEDEYFSGRTVNYVVGNEAGGGYDRYARLIAPHLEKHLPGSTVVVFNRPAGGGIAALRALSSGEPDGLEIATFNTGLLLAQIGGTDEMDVDLSTFAWLGKAASEARFLMVRADSGVTRFEDLAATDRPLRFASAAFGSAAHIQMKLLIDAFGFNARVLTGFGGSEAEAALVKGEIDGVLNSESNVLPLIEGGSAVALARFGEPTDPALMTVPDALNFATTDAQRLVARRMEIMTALGRLTAAAPGTPEPLLRTLRSAYAAALNDPELLALANSQGAPIDFLPGDQVATMVAEFLSADEEFRTLVHQALSE